MCLQKPMPSLVKGSALFFNLYDVAEEIKLDRVHELLGARPQERVFKQAAPEYVRFERQHRGFITPADSGSSPKETG